MPYGTLLLDQNIFKPILPKRSSAQLLRVRRSALQCQLRMHVMMKSKVELIYYIMVVATAVMAGIVKCTVAATCPNCSDFFDH